MRNRGFFFATVAIVALTGAGVGYLLLAEVPPAPAVSDTGTARTRVPAQAGSNRDAANDGMVDHAEAALPESVPDAGEHAMEAPAQPTRVTKTPSSPNQDPAPRLPDRYEALAARARAGDVDAARQLGVELHACGKYVESLAEIERATHPQAGGITPSQRELNDRRALAALERSKPVAAMCEGVSTGLVAEAQQWLELAANGGDLRSVNDYYALGVGRLAELATRPDDLMRFRDSSARQLHDAARRCNPEALHALAMSYRGGTVTQVDPVRAVGYGLVSAWSSGVDPRLLVPDDYRSTLTPLQFNQAVYFARRAFSSYCQ